jgi:hypothetical protein
MFMFRGDNSVLRIVRADVKSLSSKASRNFCWRSENKASSKDAFSCSGMLARWSSASLQAPERTASRNSETSIDSVLNPDSSERVWEACLFI